MSQWTDTITVSNINMDTMELSHKLQSLPTTWSSLFNLCHFLLAALTVRKEVGLSFSRLHPLATWVATITAAFAGSLIANPLLGKPILSALSNEWNVVLATGSWWVVFYCPGDLGYSLARSKVLYLPLCVIKEIYRAAKILGGITEAASRFPDQELVMVVIGLVKGNGSGLMRPVTLLVCGLWSPGKAQALGMSVTSKQCLLGAVLMVAGRSGVLPSTFSSDMVYLLIVSTFIAIKLSSLVAHPIDPFQPLEQIGAFLAFGGLWDGGRGGTKTKKIE